jgi:hypothetical protein
VERRGESGVGEERRGERGVGGVNNGGEAERKDARRHGLFEF